jgi:uncharacterized membrane-anchored protein YjiN (DUF445 family)
MSDLPEPPGRALARARRLATGVLLAFVAVFVATHLIRAEGHGLALAQAMAEAGMVGGLADWFAVTALFRHPLGIPIPHTALLPRNQARAARNVGRFFEAHFLEPAKLEERLRSIEISRHAAAWLAHPGNALALARQLVAVLATIVRAEPSPRVIARARAWLRAGLANAGADAAIAEAVARLVKTGTRSALVDEVLALVRRAVDDNRANAVALVSERSRWWIAKPVDRRVAGLAVDGVLSLLDELRTSDSALRRDFEAAVDNALDTLAANGSLERAVAEARAHLVRSGALETLALRLADTLRDRLAVRLDTDPDAVAKPLAGALSDLARRLDADPGARAALDARLAATLARVVGDLRPALGGYVAGVIAAWEPDELITRFETELGPDLQYIRVNGALLGALIGGALYGLGLLLG